MRRQQGEDTGVEVWSCDWGRQYIVLLAPVSHSRPGYRGEEAIYITIMSLLQDAGRDGQRPLTLMLTNIEGWHHLLDLLLRRVHGESWQASRLSSYISRCNAIVNRRAFVS